MDLIPRRTPEPTKFANIPTELKDQLLHFVHQNLGPPFQMSLAHIHRQAQTQKQTIWHYPIGTLGHIVHEVHVAPWFEFMWKKALLVGNLDIVEAMECVIAAESQTLQQKGYNVVQSSLYKIHAHLEFAALNENKTEVEDLLKLVNPNIGQGRIIKAAARGGKTSMVEFLLLRGASVGLELAYTKAKKHNHQTSANKLLGFLALKYNLKFLRNPSLLQELISPRSKMLCIFEQIDLNQDLDTCLEGKHFEMASILKDLGADPKYSEDRLLINHAGEGHKGAVEWLLKNGAEHKHTAMVNAITNNRYDVATLVVKSGVDMDQDGGRFFELLIKKHNFKAVFWFLTNGKTEGLEAALGLAMDLEVRCDEIETVLLSTIVQIRRKKYLDRVLIPIDHGQGVVNA